MLKGNGQLNNPSQGTSIRHTVTGHYNCWGFFLFSQHVTCGTVSPTHFLVVHDEWLSPYHLQKLTYKLTHLSYNCLKAIDVPAPCKVGYKFFTFGLLLLF